MTKPIFLWMGIVKWSRMVTDCFTMPGVRHEGPVLPGRMDYDYRCQTLGLPVKEIIADRGYSRGSTYAPLREQKIRHNIPLHDPYTPRDFSYNRQKERYLLSSRRLSLSLCISAPTPSPYGFGKTPLYLSAYRGCFTTGVFQQSV
ncbi:hypothetical protein [Nitrosococcus halophilus]|uniref:hypothetical protein n=1 Tax=Nitrosococcus halophilus TaxID=133539 RepID=UPI0012FEA823|nr:hypothetical protein [Nitrosococcus halophilus]